MLHFRCVAVVFRGPAEIGSHDHFHRHNSDFSLGANVPSANTKTRRSEESAVGVQNQFLVGLCIDDGTHGDGLTVSQIRLLMNPLSSNDPMSQSGNCPHTPCSIDS